jgi:hypothetical protein
MEAKVSDRDEGPGNKTANRGHIREISEDNPSTLADSHIGEQRESYGNDESGVRKTTLGSLGEDLRGGARDSKTKESTRGGVHIRRSSRPSRGKQAGVDDVGKDRNTGLFNTDNERRGGSIAGTGTESGIVGSAEQTNNECTEEIEQDNTNIDLSDGLGKVLARVLGFTGSDRDDFSTNVRLFNECAG